MKELGFEVMHVYGLTETYGHVTQCAWNDEWNDFDEDKQNEIKARQGVRYPNTEGVTVMDPETMKQVPYDRKVEYILVSQEVLNRLIMAKEKGLTPTHIQLAKLQGWQELLLI